LTVVTERLRPADSGPGTPSKGFRTEAERFALAGTMLLPAPLVLYLGVSSGGYPRGVTGVAATIVAVLLALRALLAPRTVRRPGAVGILGAVALLTLAGWQLLSGLWSLSPWRAIGEFDRTVLYLLVWLSLVTMPRRKMQGVMLAVGGAITILALMGLVTRLRPDVFTVVIQAASPERLSFPITYWNAMGVLTACALILCLHAAAEGRWPFAVRVLGAALFPALAATLYLTLSRGGLAVAIGGLAVYVILGRSRGLVLAVPAIAVPTAICAMAAYDATALVSRDPAGPAAVAEGRHLLVIVAVCCAAAGGLRAVLGLLDARLLEVRLPWARPAGWRRAAGWAAVLFVVAGVAVAAGAPAKVQTQYQRFLADPPTTNGDVRSRLGSVSNGGRIDHWKVAVSASRDHRWRGVGAGTFDLQWRRHREVPGLVTEAHSLYVETLSELGIAGLIMVAVFVVSLLAAAAMRGQAPPTAAAVAAVGAAWAVHAGIDWDWEVPAVTLVPLALAATAAGVPARPSNGRRRLTPVVVGVSALGLAVLPAVTAIEEVRVDQALGSYQQGRCSTAVPQAEQARSLLGLRPEPTAVLALCAARVGQLADAVELAHVTVTKDPLSWEASYLDALVVGAVGGDPRPGLLAARERDPRGVPPAALLTVLEESPRDLWAQRSAQAFVWIHGRAYSGIRP
jgi:hypothetical protein